MQYGSLCSGVEAATLAWHALGWQPQFFSEIEAFCCRLLQHRFPSVSNFGDMTKFKEWPNATIDLLVGGTPCQAFSVAGLRQGLADPRGNLALVYLGVLDRYRPRWCVWENVPGVLSSSGGRDFGAFLGALGQLGYGFAFRVLDAQFFGVPQRRRRVFVVGCLGDWRPAAAVLFECESMRGSPKKGRDEVPSPPSSGSSCGSDLAFNWKEARCFKATPLANPLRVQQTEAVLTALRASGSDVLTDRVRLLTPIECERLQGFPDNWTKVTAATKNSPRYKAIANSMAVPVMRWIGEGIAAIPPLSP